MLAMSTGTLAWRALAASNEIMKALGLFSLSISAIDGRQSRLDDARDRRQRVAEYEVEPSAASSPFINVGRQMKAVALRKITAILMRALIGE